MKYSKSFLEEHISLLKEEDRPLWGLMSAQHLVEHLIYVFKMSLGELKLDVITTAENIERYQKSLNGERRLPKFFKNPYLKKDETEALVFSSFEEAKSHLLEYAEKYETYYRTHPSAENDHVFYGRLNKEKWDLIHYKHLEHHFRQFDLLKRLPNGYVLNWIEKGGIGKVEFYHPAHNALPAHLLAKLEASIAEYGNHPKCQVIVLQSGGNRTFCAGASFHELKAISTKEEGKAFFSGFAKVILAIRNCKKMVLGRIQGKAVGGGVGLASAVDYCFATKYASVKLSELNIGIGPFVIGPAVQRKIGIAAFSQLTLDFNNFYDPSWAQNKGLYQEIFDDAETMDNRISEYAISLAKTNPEARALLKKAFIEGTERWEEEMDHRAQLSGELILSEFSKEKLKSF